MDTVDWLPEDLDPAVPSAARVYDYGLGGFHNFESDRKLGDQLVAILPESFEIMRANRAFLRRAVSYLVEDAGITQFLDIGSGIPTAGNVHEIVHAHNPHARVAYVDIDPVAVAMGQKLLEGRPNVAAVRGDFTNIDQILSNPGVTRLIDFSRPVAVLVVALLHFVPDDANPTASLTRLHTAMSAGSYLALSQGGTEGPADQRDRILATYRQTPTPVTLRSRDTTLEFFDGFDLVEPGLVGTADWHPRARDITPKLPIPIWAGVAKKR